MSSVQSKLTENWTVAAGERISLEADSSPETENLPNLGLSQFSTSQRRYLSQARLTCNRPEDTGQYLPETGIASTEDSFLKLEEAGTCERFSSKTGFCRRPGLPTGRKVAKGYRDRVLLKTARYCRLKDPRGRELPEHRGCQDLGAAKARDIPNV
ncbi:hypothetical protein J6590_023381 [Homalodisca vitripennis]|nr:hypothetical protein J6590_023381 [Homalodisca vitripennis]